MSRAFGGNQDHIDVLRRNDGLEVNGKFAKGWVKEYETGYKKYNALLKAGEKHGIEKVGQRLRGMMPWMQKRSTKGAQASY